MHRRVLCIDCENKIATPLIHVNGRRFDFVYTSFHLYFQLCSDVKSVILAFDMGFGSLNPSNPFSYVHICSLLSVCAMSALTSSSGQSKFTVSSSRETYTLTVSNVTKAGCIFDTLGSGLDKTT